MRTVSRLSLLLALALPACSESTSEPADAGRRLPDAGSVDAGAPHDGGPAPADGGPRDDAGAPADGGASAQDGGGSGTTLVINEIQPSGTDYIEVVNASGTALNVGGWTVTQVDEAGEPELDRGGVFPVDTVLPPGAYELVLTDEGGGEGFQTTCLEAAVAVERCLYGDFGISASSGDTLVIVDDEGTVVESVLFPGGSVGADESFQRQPDMTGEFTAGTPSPGSINE